MRCVTCETFYEHDTDRSVVASQKSDFSPALLKRARAVASEHASLREKLAVDFDPVAAKKLGQTSSVTSALKEWEKANEVNNSLSQTRHLQVLTDSLQVTC